MKTKEQVASNIQVRKSNQWLALTLMGGACLLALSGCEARDGTWESGVGDPSAVGLVGSVALHDQALNRVVFLTSEKSRALETRAFPLGQNVTAMLPSRDQKKLFVLSRGVFPRINPEDEGPQLLVFDGGVDPKLERDPFLLDDPMKNLAIDPEGEWVAAYEGDATVTNPNELVLLSLKKGSSSAPVSKTIRSFGGSPEQLMFTSKLGVPEGGERRFMVVRTDRDITLVDLKNLDQDEITIKLPQNDEQVAYQPLEVVYDDGDPEDNEDSRFAIRLAGTSDVVMLQLARSENTKKDFQVEVNIVDVGGVPTSIEFVRTDGGLRLAALVPGSQRATLVNPETTYAESVDLPHRFNMMTRITSALGDAPDGGDVALLWEQGGQDIAFWSLGSTSATPYRSVESNELDIQIQRVMDVPKPNEHLKVLVGPTGSGFFVLDLKKRQSFPLNTQGQGFDVKVSMDGERLWVSAEQENTFSAVQLSNLHPQALYVEPRVNGIFDIERADGKRSAIVLHTDSGWAATVMDGRSPSSADTSFYPALHLEGLK